MLSGGITAELSSGLPVVAYRVAEIRFMEAELREQAELAPESLPCATDRVVVDVGANVGLFTLLARYRAPHAKVVAIEPVPELFSLLSANVALHGVDAACVRAAMGEDRGIRRFTFYPGLSLMSGFYADDASDRAMVTRFERQRTSTNPDQDDVVAMALDDAFRAPRRDACEVAALSHVFRDHALDRIDLLKVDVERAELEVLRGISPPDWKRVGRVVVEAESSVIEDVRDTLERQGLTVRCVRLPLLTQTGLALVIGTRGPSSLPEDGLTALAAPPYASPTAVETALRLFTAEHLPTYMVPSRFVLVPELPTLSSGKVDRSALRERHVRERGSAPGPRRKASGGMEQLFCDAWAATLGLASVGPDDDFFELGGHSLAAARVIAVVRAAGVDIPLRLLFDHPTPSGLASAVKREEPVRR
jgi:FkbM family methyltransferase